MSRTMISEKLDQAVRILDEFEIDMWLTFVRESSASPDPMLDLILGTHCTWQSALIVTRDNKKIALVGSLDAQNIRDHAPYEVRTYVNAIKPDLLTLLRSENPDRIAVNYSENDALADGLSHGLFLLLQNYLEGTCFAERLVSSEPVVAALRGRKSPGEIRRIQAAIGETLDIFDRVTDFVRTGMTEKDVAAFIRGETEARGLEPAWDPVHCPGVFTGPDSAGAHAGPTDRVIEPGHILNIDFGVRKDDYVSDLQRTWYFMKPGEEEVPEPVRHGFQTIVDAIRKAADFLKPGRMGWEVDAVAREWIVNAGYGEYPHGLGHQVGRKAHDGSTLLCPKWDRYGRTPFRKVEEGQVFTLEPRLTVEGCGIATVEEIVLVTREGTRFLSTPQKEIYRISSQKTASEPPAVT
ncbi:MAG TPA: aminopeptidase P family protein [bacterium]|nr:aminopeptidase P family protein [bacterium]